MRETASAPLFRLLPHAERTDREHDVLRQVIAGRPNKRIAEALHISVRTVEAHRARVFEKREIDSAVERTNLLRHEPSADARSARPPVPGQPGPPPRVRVVRRRRIKPGATPRRGDNRAMPIGEFELIARWFTRPAARAVLAGGDDCALLAVRPGMQLAVSCDMLVEGRHFLSSVAPARLGHKALAVNLSDLAACGAEPLAFNLALALPRADEAFLDPFARGLFALADAHRIELVGGDTTMGPLNICITVFGEVPAGAALLRAGARAGDELWVSGALGDARLALEAFRGHVALAGDALDRARRAMELPQPRVALGVALRGVATSAIDVSDGLLGDIGHVLAASKVGATIEVDAVPRSADLAAQPLAVQRLCTLAGGDDYELAFSAPPDRADAVRAAGQTAQVAVTRIGRIDAVPGLRLRDAAGAAVADDFASFDHFRT